MNRAHWEILKGLPQAGVNSPHASSMGRLFDALASLVLVRYKADFEAELAIEMEKEACRYNLRGKLRKPGESAYPFRITRHNAGLEINPLPLFRQVVADLKAGEPKGKIAYRFHLTAARMIVKTCALLKKQSGTDKVVMSGGVFQNNLLLNLSKRLLYKEGFKCIAQNKLACNDSNVSLGQAVVAGLKRKRR